MSERNVVYNVHGGGGCFRIILFIISIYFFCTWCVKSCERGSAWGGAVDVVKEYKDLADSIWNE